MNKNIMIVGVGGQGTLLASRIIGNTLSALGHDVKVSEVHGMSQRGGSVVTYVKYGQNVAAPTIEQGCADIILAFELLEGYRWVPYLKKGGKMIASTQQIDPMPVITGAADYPGDIGEKIEKLGVDLKLADALTAAQEAGSERAVNVVLLGALAKILDIPKENWEESIRQTVKANFAELNLKAFTIGYSLI